MVKKSSSNKTKKLKSKKINKTQEVSSRPVLDKKSFLQEILFLKQIAPVIGVFAGIFFLGTNPLTSSAQFSPVVNSFDWKSLVGVILILGGLIAGFFLYEKNKQ